MATKINICIVKNGLPNSTINAHTTVMQLKIKLLKNIQRQIHENTFHPEPNGPFSLESVAHATLFSLKSDCESNDWLVVVATMPSVVASLHVKNIYLGTAAMMVFDFSHWGLLV